MSDLYSQIPKAYDDPKSSGLLPGSWFLFPVVIFWSNCGTDFVNTTDVCPCGLPSPLTAEQECQPGPMNALVTVGFQLVLLIHIKVPGNKLPSSENRTELYGRKQMEDTPQAVLLPDSLSTPSHHSWACMRSEPQIKNIFSSREDCGVKETICQSKQGDKEIREQPITF